MNSTKEYLDKISKETTAVASELLHTAGLKPGSILVVGCSTSEVQGATLGTCGSQETAIAILTVLQKLCRERQVYLALQCCEHLNRALVVEYEAAVAYRLNEVAVIPVLHAGGALAAQAMQSFKSPVVVETITAQAGLDIGDVLIGMHLQTVAVPVRLQQKYIGQARVIAARTRPKRIGGARAVYAD